MNTEVTDRNPAQKADQQDDLSSFDLANHNPPHCKTWLKYVSTATNKTRRLSIPGFRGVCARVQGQLVAAYLNSHISVHCMKEKVGGGSQLCSLQVTCQSVHYSGDKIPTLGVQ